MVGVAKGERTIGPEEAERFEREETERFFRDHPEVIPWVIEAIERLRDGERRAEVAEWRTHTNS